MEDHMGGAIPQVYATGMRVPRRMSVVTDLVVGAAAGAAATWVMGQATTWMYAWEDEQARDRENRAREGKTAYARAADRIARGVNRDLSDEQQEQAGSALHWMTGLAAGAAYAVASRRWPAVRRAGGLPFGTGFFLTIDEGMNAVLGFTPGPRAFPWQAHARGLAGHLVFGLTVETMLSIYERVSSRKDTEYLAA
jgi:hypothetical protein